MSIGALVTGYGPIRVLALHGWLSDMDVYDPVLPFFDHSKYTIARMDQRGYGLSRHQKGVYTIEEIAADALQLSRELGWERFHVLAHSMGGIVMQRMALLSPAQIASGIAITPGPASGYAMDHQTRSFFESSADSDDALREIFSTLMGGRYATGFLSSMVHNARRATTRAAYLGYLDAWTNANFADEVATIQAPVTVIAGRFDAALGPSKMEETYLKQLRNVRMKVIESAGHYPTIEAPAELFTLVEMAMT